MLHLAVKCHFNTDYLRGQRSGNCHCQIRLILLSFSKWKILKKFLAIWHVTISALFESSPFPFSNTGCGHHMLSLEKVPCRATTNSAPSLRFSHDIVRRTTDWTHWCCPPQGFRMGPRLGVCQFLFSLWYTELRKVFVRENVPCKLRQKW